MAADFHAKGLDGMAQWMEVQTQEEMVHAMRFFRHIDERNGRVELKVLAAPQKEWASPLAAFEAAYQHEQFITARIDELTKIAREENDNAALMMLPWFINEQIEEEANVSKVIDLLKLVGDAGQGLLMAGPGAWNARLRSARRGGRGRRSGVGGTRWGSRSSQTARR